MELCIYNLCQKTTFTSLSNKTSTRHLEELSKGVEEGGDTSSGHGSGVHNGSAGSGATRVAGGAGAGAGAGLAVGGGGVIGARLAFVSTVDNLALHLLEFLAGEGAVGGLQVEATGDLLKRTELNTGGDAC